VFKNPVALFTGGVAAVLMELAEPRVRTGVWEHTTFRQDPIARLRRTGLAAMITIYGARSVAESTIARVRRIHDLVIGTTPSGQAYRANHPELLNWVHATAAYSFPKRTPKRISPTDRPHNDATVPTATALPCSGALPPLLYPCGRMRAVVLARGQLGGPLGT
jgi:ER-bound oxygenase mpaB/B'/Rubber oxygenase, catalytic domain